MIDRLATLIPRVTRETIDGAAHVPQLSTAEHDVQLKTRALRASRKDEAFGS